jgi:hypothetical protein
MEKEIADGDGKSMYKEYISIIENYLNNFFGKYKVDAISHQLIEEFVRDILRKTKDELEQEKGSVNMIIKIFGLKHIEEINYFIDELIKKEFYLFDTDKSIKNFNKMTKSIQTKIIDENIKVSKNNTRDYINFFASDRDDPNNHELFKNVIGNDYFINLFQEKILEYLNKEINGKKTINVYTFDSLKDYNINFTDEFKTQIVELIRGRGVRLYYSAIVGLKINYTLFNEGVINVLLKEYPDLAIAGLLGETNMLNALKVNGLFYYFYSIEFRGDYT